MARDFFHDAVRTALIADGWTITHDPYTLAFGDQNLFIDLGAERVLAAEKSGNKIAVEVKSFVGRSPVNDLEQALGQYMLYERILDRREPERALFLAIPIGAYKGVLDSAVGRLAVTDFHIRLIVFDPEKERVEQWIE